jgi:hypothetical protein
MTAEEAWSKTLYARTLEGCLVDIHETIDLCSRGGSDCVHMNMPQDLIIPIALELEKEGYTVNRHEWSIDINWKPRISRKTMIDGVITLKIDPRIMREKILTAHKEMIKRELNG